MNINELRVENLRILEDRSFKLSPRMNVFIGENGAGKSSVLDALRVSLSRAIPTISEANGGYINVGKKDITQGKSALRVDLDIQLGYANLEYTARYDSEGWASGWHSVPPLNHILEEVRSQPLAIHFSSRRFLPGGTNQRMRAHQGSLALRGLNIKSFVYWWQTRFQLAEEGLESAQQQLEALSTSVSSFLGGEYRLDGLTDDESSIRIRKGDTLLDILQLSDGERGMLALVLDLTKRLTQANKDLENPLQDSEAVVLIDELALHLHPKWQRRIVEKLKNTFPKCQFVCTTHSPFIVQTLEEEELHSLDNFRPVSQMHNLGIEAIAEGLMGVEETEVSPQYAEMKDAAKEYLIMLEEADTMEPRERFENFKERLAKKIRPYADNPAYQAFLELQRIGRLGE